jgi:hypothetical protein
MSVVTAFRLLTARLPTAAQLKSMSALITEAREHYTQHPSDAALLLKSAGESPLDASLPAAEVASTLMMTRALLSSAPFVTSY